MILFLKNYIAGNDEWVEENYKQVNKKDGALLIITMIFYSLLFVVYKSIPMFYKKTHCWLSLQLYNISEMHGLEIMLLITGIVVMILAWCLYIDSKINKVMKEIKNADIG